MESAQLFPPPDGRRHAQPARRQRVCAVTRPALVLAALPPSCTGPTNSGAAASRSGLIASAGALPHPGNPWSPFSCGAPTRLAGWNPNPRGEETAAAGARHLAGRISRAPSRFSGSSTAGGLSPTSPSDAAPRSRAHQTRRTKPLTKVYARSRPLVLDLTDGRAQGWTVFQIPSTPGRCFARRPSLVVAPELRSAPRTAAPSVQPSRSPPPVTA